jgi:hypothetical protein
VYGGEGEDGSKDCIVGRDWRGAGPDSPTVFLPACWRDLEISRVDSL